MQEHRDSANTGQVGAPRPHHQEDGRHVVDDHFGGVLATDLGPHQLMHIAAQLDLVVPF